MLSQLSGLIQTAYDAAGSEQRWQSFLQQYVETFGAGAAGLMHQAHLSPQTSFEQGVGLEERWVNALHQHYQYVNPYLPLLSRIPVGGSATIGQLLPKQMGLRTEFYCDFVAPQAMHYESVATRLEAAPGDRSALLVHYRADQQTNAIEASLPAHHLMAPHIQGALRLHQRVVDLERGQSSLLAALDCARTAVAVCEGNGRVRLLTTDAELLLNQNDGLFLHHGLLCSSRCRGRMLLAQAISSVAQLTEGRAGGAPAVVKVMRPSGRADYELLVSPVPRRQNELRYEGGRVLVFLHDPDQTLTSDGEVLALLYKLTPRERQTLQLVVAGASATEIADYMGVGGETVRSHLKGLFAKLGVRSQTQLVRTALQGLARLRLLQAKAAPLSP